MTRDYLYLAPESVMRADPPRAGYRAHSAPDDPTLWIVAVAMWDSVQVQDQWEALPGVICLHVEEHGMPAPVQALSAFRSWGAKPGQSRRDFLTAVRKLWPEPRL